MLFNILKKTISRIQLTRYRRYVLSQVAKGMHLGKNVGIMPGVKFDPPHSFLTSIGDNCIIAPDVRFLNHDASAFIFKRRARIGQIIIKERCFIGAGAILLPGIEIGPDVIIGAGSVVSRSIPPGSVAAGNPAKVLKTLESYLETMNIPGRFAMQSPEFYRRINELSTIDQFKNDIGLIGYTIETDGNTDYYFNID